MDERYSHFRVAPVSSTRPQKEDLHLQLKSRAGQKPWQRVTRQTLEGAWKSSKPLIAAYLAKKLAEQAKMPGSK
jgi:hypothetical protein